MRERASERKRSNNRGVEHARTVLFTYRQKGKTKRKFNVSFNVFGIHLAQCKWHMKPYSVNEMINASERRKTVYIKSE